MLGLYPKGFVIINNRAKFFNLVVSFSIDSIFRIHLFSHPQINFYQKPAAYQAKKFCLGTAIGPLAAWISDVCETQQFSIAPPIIDSEAFPTLSHSGDNFCWEVFIHCLKMFIETVLYNFIQSYLKTLYH